MREWAAAAIHAATGHSRQCAACLVDGTLRRLRLDVRTPESSERLRVPPISPSAGTQAGFSPTMTLASRCRDAANEGESR